MDNKTKLFVALAFIGAGFYTLEIILTIRDKGFVNTLIVKAFLVIAFITYAVMTLLKK